jgi:tRNA pseudouridine55 synthase
MNYEGILLIWKPVDFTSHDVVAKARRILGIKRIGHTGTLDPKVTGVLPLCIGRATRLVEYIQEMPKEYQAKLVIGLATDTEDLTGEIVEESDQVTLDPGRIRDAIASFIGEIDQIPPMYSAVKVDGKRLYELARKGEVVERKSRSVTIHRIDILSMNLNLPKPEIEIRVLCSKGTYIRTLCADIGKALGYPAVMAELVRTATGGFNKEQCVTLEQLAEAKSQGGEALLKLLIPSDEAVSFIPSITINDTQAVHALQGKKLNLQGNQAAQSATVSVVLPDHMKALKRLYSDGRFLGLFRLEADEQTLVPEKVFLPEA